MGDLLLSFLHTPQIVVISTGGGAFAAVVERPHFVFGAFPLLSKSRYPVILSEVAHGTM